MAIDTQKHIRKPLYVDAVRITQQNFDEIVTWCQGEVQTDEVPGQGTGKKYIKVRVHNPKNPRQTKAYVGDWLLYTERGYKVYTNKAFNASFDPVTAEEAPLSDPRLTGDPVRDASIEDARLHSVGPVAENPSSETGVQKIEEVVPATPHTIAQAVSENESARMQLEAHTVEDVPPQETVEPIAAEGKRVLSIEEQKMMSQDEIQELIRSGEAVLVQDLAA